MIRWVLYFPIGLFIGLFCRLTNPIACLFVVKRPRTDIVKRFAKIRIALDREYLWGIFYLWQTHDNACDEYWYGCYNESSWFKTVRNWSLNSYLHSWIIRYVCRVLWLNRNAGYGWNYLLLSIPKGQGFQIKKQIPLCFGYVNDVNIGWKAHKGKDRLFYAGRILGLRKAK